MATNIISSSRSKLKVILLSFEARNLVISLVLHLDVAYGPTMKQHAVFDPSDHELDQHLLVTISGDIHTTRQGELHPLPIMLSHVQAADGAILFWWANHQLV